ncbi:MAG: hypothetical protein ABI561_09980 [Bradyrhizobium sp.]
MNNVSEKGTDFIQDLGDAVRKNPLSAALIGMGVLWLFSGARPMERAGDFARSTGLDRIPDAAGNALDAARSTLSSGTDAVGDRVASTSGVVKDRVVDAVDNATRYGREYADTASEYVASIPGSGAEMLDTVRSNLSDLFKAQPLALGAIGIAIGAGIAVALPGTETEADYLGATSDTVKAKAAQFAAEQTDRVTSVAAKVVEAAKNEAATQGLTLEGVKTAAGDISAKVGRVFDATGKSISDRANLGKL